MAPPNILSIVVAFETSQPLMSLLNFTALKNIRCIISTLDTSQPLMSLLNFTALKNIFSISVTLDTSHPLISSLKLALFLNNSPILVTCETSQSDICPYLNSAEAESPIHSPTAVLRVSLSNVTANLQLPYSS